MNIHTPLPSTAFETRPGETVVLVFQGGGALGAYQSGVFAGLHKAGVRPHWIAGVSIGAINAALIAGNAPERRVDALQRFWHRVSAAFPFAPLLVTDDQRRAFNETSAAAALFGVPGFYAPRLPPALLSPPGDPTTLGLYDTSPLRRTLEDLVDFDRLNDGEIRVSLGAVNVGTGRLHHFDTATTRIGPEHVMASGALPPSFPPIEIDGEFYWDGALVSNTPLQYVLDDPGRGDLLVVQADLFSASGPLPRTLFDLSEREKDIRYASRARLDANPSRQRRRVLGALARLLEKLPEHLDDDVDAEILREVADDSAATIVHLVNRRRAWSRDSKDYEFSRRTARERWADGEADAARAVVHPAVVGRRRVPYSLDVVEIDEPA